MSNERRIHDDLTRISSENTSTVSAWTSLPHEHNVESIKSEVNCEKKTPQIRITSRQIQRKQHTEHISNNSYWLRQPDTYWYNAVTLFTKSEQSLQCNEFVTHAHNSHQIKQKSQREDSASPSQEQETGVQLSTDILFGRVESTIPPVFDCNFQQIRGCRNAFD